MSSMSTMILSFRVTLWQLTRRSEPIQVYSQKAVWNKRTIWLFLYATIKIQSLLSKLIRDNTFTLKKEKNDNCFSSSRNFTGANVKKSNA